LSAAAHSSRLSPAKAYALRYAAVIANGGGITRF
jgi:hypothetical protein